MALPEVDGYYNCFISVPIIINGNGDYNKQKWQILIVIFAITKNIDCHFCLFLL